MNTNPNNKGINVKTNIIAVLVAGLTGHLCAEEPRCYVYEGQISGVVCSVCSSNVKEALSSIKGVTSVKIIRGKQGDIPRLEITSTSSGLTKDAAVKALGAAARSYDIRFLRLKAEEEAPSKPEKNQ